MKNNIYQFLSNLKYRTGALALIDPDSKNDKKLDDIIEKANLPEFDAILVGGSSLDDNKYHHRIKKIKNSTSKPVILFPGSSNQINKNVDAIFYLSLISGRNPKYLIEEHIKSSKSIHKLDIETIPVGYILIDGDKISAVEKISNTIPINSSEVDKIVSHALAGQYLGHKFIFLESGSGAKKSAGSNLIKILKNYLDIPLIVGGGIKTFDDVKNIKDSSPNFIVIGNLLESDESIINIKEMLQLIHE